MRGQYALALGDDALVLAQRLGEWVARAPELEEDIALANIALDLLGQARTLLSYAGEQEGEGRDEDALAYWRDDREFRNVLLVELPNGDFAATMARQLVFAAYQYELYDRLRAGTDDTLAAIAGKAVKEVHYHRDHATQWVLRLGDGTDESRRRMVAALDAVWPYAGELFEPFDGADVDPATLREPWTAYVHGVLAEAGLDVPEPTAARRGGRAGLHTEHLGYLLAELQHLHRSHPGVTW
ncbi:1,2-phenylacetyl-CoA epoxidase subunit PaaC [Jiangella muralis]|uniref:1,2-phenylacetyl-CoA epoxidase subunit PaaC n=1 Tax=Jiangella muralis TaxID=702383 RepID=UPI00069E1D59|nr:1,2-phenylacetyl-CoA epoxidase subunit PaaC [Jiangella muralis]